LWTLGIKPQRKPGSPPARCELAEKLAEALRPKGKENQKVGGAAGGSSPSKGSSILKKANVDAWDQAAKEAGVSTGSV
jgi:hypothetical protein